MDWCDIEICDVRLCIWCEYDTHVHTHIYDLINQIRIRNLLGINQPPQEKSVSNTQMGWSPVIDIPEGVSPDSSIPKQKIRVLLLSHALNTAPFKSHTELYLGQSSDRDSHRRCCWLNTKYNHTSWKITGSVLPSWFEPDSWLNLRKKQFPKWSISFFKAITSYHFEKLPKGTPHQPLSPQ